MISPDCDAEAAQIVIDYPDISTLQFVSLWLSRDRYYKHRFPLRVALDDPNIQAQTSDLLDD